MNAIVRPQYEELIENGTITLEEAQLATAAWFRIEEAIHPKPKLSFGDFEAVIRDAVSPAIIAQFDSTSSLYDRWVKKDTPIAVHSRGFRMPFYVMEKGEEA